MIYLMCGNIGSGKTTFAKSLLNENILYVSEDALCEMMTHNYASSWDDRHWRLYRSLKETAVCEALFNGFNIVVDGCHINKNARKKFVRIANNNGVDIVLHYFESPHWRDRRSDCRGVDLAYWQEVYDRMQKDFEEPTEDEGFVDIIRHIT